MRVWRSSIPIIIIFCFLLLLNQPNFVVTSQLEDDLEVIWLVESPVTTSKFPIGFFTYKDYNISIQTTWNFTLNDTITSFHAVRIRWIDLPSTNGSGQVTVFIDGVFHDTYSVQWKSYQQPVKDAQLIEFSYYLFGHWSGETLLSVKLFNNLSFSVNYEVLRDAYGIEDKSIQTIVKIIS